MSRIVVLRHGPVACARPLWPGRADFAAYCAAYDRAPLKPGHPPAGLGALCSGVRLFASSARRGVDTALQLAPQGEWRFDPIFAEEPMTAPDLEGRWPLALWLALARARESWSRAALPQRLAVKARAELAARLLADNAPCLLVGHGWFNRHIEAALASAVYRAARPVLSTRLPSHWSARLLSGPA